MAIFYGAYIAVSGLLVSLCESVEIAKTHRVFFVLLDSFVVAYICIINTWFRNKLIGWTNFLSKIEKR